MDPVGAWEWEGPMRDAAVVQHCELQLPPYTPADETVVCIDKDCESAELADASEIEAALRSTEFNCEPCDACDACPQTVEGRWYSDTAYATFDSCDAVPELQAKEYNCYPMLPTLSFQEGAKVLLAKFEVQEVE